MKLRKIDLITADGLPPLPMQISWVRDGILVVGMDSEMHVYSQWKPDCKWWLFMCTYTIFNLFLECFCVCYGFVHSVWNS